MNDAKMAITPKGLIFIIVGVLVLILGYILLSGGGVTDPQVFNYDMFSFRRMVLAPIVMTGGLVIVALAILGVFDKVKFNKKHD